MVEKWRIGGPWGGDSSGQPVSGEYRSRVNLEHGFKTPSHKGNAAEYEERSSEQYQFCCLESYRSDLEAIDWLNESYAIEHDLREPFERIIEALSEAHPRTKAA